MQGEERHSDRLSFPDALADTIRNSACDFIVTGGSGWIGQASLEMLDSALGEALPERVRVFGSGDKLLHLRSGRRVQSRGLDALMPTASATYLIHCAFLTKDRLTDQSVESFVASNQAISDKVAAVAKASNIRGLFVPSSGAVYKKGTHTLDDNLQTNAYGVMKIAEEKRFTALATAKKIPLCMPRLFNLAGPFINKHDLYALASMIKAVLANQPITIRAAHNVIRSYIHVQDLVRLAFAMMLNPQAGDQPVFDTAGDESLELDALAKDIRRALNHSDLAINRPEHISGRDDVYVGDGQHFQDLMKRHNLALTPMATQIIDTAAFMRNLNQPD